MYDIIVIGSGLSALSFFDALELKNRKVAVISYHNNENKNYDYPRKLNILKKYLPPRFSLDDENINDVKKYFLKNNIIFDKDVSIFGYLNDGGVSNYWGCSCQFPNVDEINFLKNDKKKKLIEAFQKIYKKYNFSGNFNLKDKNQINNSKKIDNSFLEIIKNNINDDVNFYENCVAVDNINNLKFIPKNYKKTIYDKATHLNYFVKKISKEKDFFILNCTNNDKEMLVKTKKLVLATGTLVTTKLVSDMLNYNETIKIAHNPMLLGFFITKSNLKNDNFSPSLLAADVKSSTEEINSLANFRGSNNLIKQKILNNYFFMKNPFSKKIYDHFEKKLLFVNLYLDSKFGNLEFDRKGNNSLISSNKINNIKIKEKLFDSFNKIYKNLRVQNFILPFKFGIFPPIGNDSHYTGTIPIKGSNNILSLNENSELINYQGLYIVDGSAIPKNNLKFPTGLIMANAYRVGELI